MFDHIGWIVEAKIKSGRREQFRAIVSDIVKETQKESGTLTYKYFVSDDGDVLVLEQFEDVDAAHRHIDNWDQFSDRWLEVAPGTRMVHLGNLPDELRQRHAALSPKLLKAFDGFSR